MQHPPPNDLRLRWFISADTPSVIRLESSVPRGWTAKQIFSLLGRHRTSAIVIGRPGYDVGYILFSCIDYWTSDRSIYPNAVLQIHRLIVDPKFRRRRIGSWLIEAADRQIIKSMTTNISPKDGKTGILPERIRVADDLTDTHLFLRNIGFSATKIIYNHEERDEYAFSRLSSWEYSIWKTTIKTMTCSSILSLLPPKPKS